VRDNDHIILENLYNEAKTVDLYKKYYDDGKYEKCMELAQKAAYTQRANPETTMLKTQRKLQKNGTPNMFTDLIEHIGDLSHRAQEPYGRALENVDEKIRKVEATMQPNRWDLERELDEGCYNEATSEIIRNTPELKKLEDSVGQKGGPKYMYEVYQYARKNYNDEILKRARETKANTYKILEGYVKAHEEHNQPVTVLGELGKQAAIFLGKLDFGNLRETVQVIRQWLEDYYKIPYKDEKARSKFFLTPKKD
jgi:hypothetical protein